MDIQIEIKQTPEKELEFRSTFRECVDMSMEKKEKRTNQLNIFDLFLSLIMNLSSCVFITC